MDTSKNTRGEKRGHESQTSLNSRLNTSTLKRKELPHCAVTETTQHNRLVTEGTSITIGIIGRRLVNKPHG